MDIKNKSRKLLDIVNFIGLVFFIYNLDNFSGLDLHIDFYAIGIIFLYFFGRFIKSSKIIEIFHVLWAVMIIGVPFFAQHRSILFLHITVILFTLCTRKMYNGCIVRNLEEKGKNKISNNFLTKKLNWDLLFPLVGFVSTIRLYLYSNKKEEKK